MIRLIHYKKYFKIKLGPSPPLNHPSSPLSPLHLCTSLLAALFVKMYIRLFTSTNFNHLDYNVTCLHVKCDFSPVWDMGGRSTLQHFYYCTDCH